MSQVSVERPERVMAVKVAGFPRIDDRTIVVRVVGRRPVSIDGVFVVR